MVDARNLCRAYLAAMPGQPAVEQFLEALAARDFGLLASTFASGARARLLLPRGMEEHLGAGAISRRIESWFGTAADFELKPSAVVAVGSRIRLGWRVSLVREGRPREVLEQAAFVDVALEGITQLDLVCSGFQVEPASSALPTLAFDAGALGCGDGLAQEFRRRLAGVPLGGSLEVTVSDPGAKQDLPSLARLLGQRVASTEAREDGRLVITVERTK